MVGKTRSGGRPATRSVSGSSNGRVSNAGTVAGGVSGSSNGGVTKSGRVARGALTVPEAATQGVAAQSDVQSQNLEDVLRGMTNALEGFGTLLDKLNRGRNPAVQAAIRTLVATVEATALDELTDKIKDLEKRLGRKQAELDSAHAAYTTACACFDEANVFARKRCEDVRLKDIHISNLKAQLEQQTKNRANLINELNAANDKVDVVKAQLEKSTEAKNAAECVVQDLRKELDVLENKRQQMDAALVQPPGNRGVDVGVGPEKVEGIIVIDDDVPVAKDVPPVVTSTLPVVTDTPPMVLNSPSDSSSNSRRATLRVRKNSRRDDSGATLRGRKEPRCDDSDLSSDDMLPPVVVDPNLRALAQGIVDRPPLLPVVPGAKSSACVPGASACVPGASVTKKSNVIRFVIPPPTVAPTSVAAVAAVAAAVPRTVSTVDSVLTGSAFATGTTPVRTAAAPIEVARSTGFTDADTDSDDSNEEVVQQNAPSVAVGQGESHAMKGYKELLSETGLEAVLACWQRMCAIWKENKPQRVSYLIHPTLWLLDTKNKYPATSTDGGPFDCLVAINRPGVDTGNHGDGEMLWQFTASLADDFVSTFPPVSIAQCPNWIACDLEKKKLTHVGIGDEETFDVVYGSHKNGLFTFDIITRRYVNSIDEVYPMVQKFVCFVTFFAQVPKVHCRYTRQERRGFRNLPFFVDLGKFAQAFVNRSLFNKPMTMQLRCDIRRRPRETCLKLKWYYRRDLLMCVAQVFVNGQITVFVRSLKEMVYLEHVLNELASVAAEVMGVSPLPVS